MGPEERLVLIDRTLEGALWYLKDGVMTVGCRLCKMETQVKQFWTCQVLSGCHFRNAFLTWHAYTSDMCVNTLLISSFQSLFPCFHF